MNIYLSLADVLEIHRIVIAQTGGDRGIRDRALLDAAVNRSLATFDGVDLYPTLLEKAAALFHSLILNHPFVDGNKRVAFTATDVYLRLHGWRFSGEEDELYNFVIAVASGQVTFSAITAWMQQHVVADTDR